MDEPRWELRAAAARLPYDSLKWLARHPNAPEMHRAEARREMRRRDRSDAAWISDFLSRYAPDA